MASGRFAPPSLDFSMLAELPNRFRAGQQQRREDDLREAFKDGFPRGPAGEIDYGTAYDLLAQHDPISAFKYASGYGQGGASVYGTPIYGIDPQTGETVLGAMTKSGGFQRLDTGGVVPTPGVSFQNLGTTVQPFSSKTGAPVAPPTPIDVAGEQAQQAQGKAQGEAVSGLPNALAKSEQALKTIDDLMKHPGRGIATGKSATFDPRNYYSSPAMDYQVALKQAQGQVFLDAYERLKGGGVITEIEGQKAEQAIARLDPNQTDAAHLQGLKDLREVIVAGQARAKQRAAQPAAQPAPPQQAGVVDVYNSGGGARPVPNPQQIQMLRQHANNPEARQTFEEFYGAGSADWFLQGGR